MGPQNIFEPPSENHLIDRRANVPRYGVARAIVDGSQEIPERQRKATRRSDRAPLHHHQAGWSSASALKCSLGVRWALTAEDFSPVTECFSS